MALIITGALGLLWVIPWLLLYRVPQESKWVTAAKLALIEDGVPKGSAAETQAWSWGQVIRFRPLWLLLVGRMLTDPVWHFYQFWFSKYLNTGRGYSTGSTNSPLLFRTASLETPW